MRNVLRNLKHLIVQYNENTKNRTRRKQISAKLLTADILILVFQAKQ